MFATILFCVTALVGSVLSLTQFGLDIKAMQRANKLGWLNKYINQITTQLNNNSDLRMKVENAYANRNQDLIVALGQGGAFSATYNSILQDRHKLRKEYTNIMASLDKSDEALKKSQSELNKYNSEKDIDKVDFNKVDNLVNGALSTKPSTNGNTPTNGGSSGVSSVDDIISGGISRPTEPVKRPNPPAHRR